MAREPERIHKRFADLKPTQEPEPDFVAARRILLRGDSPSPPDAAFPVQHDERGWWRIRECAVAMDPANPETEALAGSWLPVLAQRERPVTLALSRLSSEYVLAVSESPHGEATRLALESAYPGIVLAPWSPPRLSGGAWGRITGIPAADHKPAQLPLNRILDSSLSVDFVLWVQLVPLSSGEMVSLVEQLKRAEALARRYASGTLTISQQQASLRSVSEQRDQANAEAALFLDQVTRALKRMQNGLATGLWRWSGVLWAPTRSLCDQLGGLCRGLWGSTTSEGETVEYAPIRLASSTVSTGSIVQIPASQSVGDTPSIQSIVTSDELRSVSHLPTRDAPGYTTYPLVRFATAVMSVPAGAAAVNVGTVLDISRETGLSWSLTLSALTHHCFVTGTTGSGKSNTCRYLLEQLHAHGIPFWVLEPAKREYRSLLKHRALRDRVRVYTPGNERVAPLRLNLFQPPAGTLLSEWIGGLKTVISSSFALYGSMPQLLERSLYQAYEEQGWNTARDVVSAKESRAFPTLTSFVATLTTVIDEAGYGRELSADFHGALTTRIRSLTLGSTGAMLNSTVRCDVRELLCYPTIFEFASVTNDQELSLLMGVLLLNLAAVRRSDGSSANLKHLLVLEEAHRLLPALGPLAETSEVAQTRSQAVNLFVNMLAELRASGQGFVLADQSPEKIVSDALKNTGTKIVHRLPDLPDRNAVGNTMALTAIQKTALARLNKGAAVVYTEGPTPAALVHVPLMLTLPPVTDEEIRKSMAPHLLVEQTASAGPALSAKITTPERPEQSETGLFRGVELLRCLLSGKTPDDLQPDQVRQYVADRAAFLRIETGEADRLQHLLLDAADRTLTNDQNRRAWEQFAADMSRLMLAKRHEQTRCADCPSHVCYGAETEGMMASVAWWQALRQSLESGDAAALREFSTAVAHHPDMTMDSSTEPVRSALVRCLGIRVLAEFDFAEPWATFNRLG